MSRLALAILVVSTVACASAPPVPLAYVDPRPPLVRLADSTTHLVAYAAEASDTANIHARIALRERSPDRARERVSNARLAARNATLHVDAAITQGESIRASVSSVETRSEESTNYTRYWGLGREKLILARERSLQAVAAADSALACEMTECTTSQTTALQNHIEQAAGHTREAESLVRIAMVYVAMAMNYIR
jgi:hypothetical protein